MIKRSVVDEFNRKWVANVVMAIAFFTAGFLREFDIAAFLMGVAIWCRID